MWTKRLRRLIFPLGITPPLKRDINQICRHDVLLARTVSVARIALDSTGENPIIRAVLVVN
jgi:hypothetical protein